MARTLEQHAKRQKIAEGFAKFYLRLGRGHALSDFIITTIKNIVYLGAGSLLIQKWFGFLPSYWIVIVLGVSYEVYCYSIGTYDEKVGFWKFQNAYANKQLNPFFEEMEKKIDKIYKEIRNVNNEINPVTLENDNL